MVGASMAERVRAISPDCAVRPRMEFFTARNAEDIFRERYDAVLDAIDSVADKCRLIALCRQLEEEDTVESFLRAAWGRVTVSIEGSIP